MLGAQVALSVYLPATGLKRSELELVLGPITFLRVCGRSGGAGFVICQSQCNMGDIRAVNLQRP